MRVDRLKNNKIYYKGNGGETSKKVQKAHIVEDGHLHSDAQLSIIVFILTWQNNNYNQIYIIIYSRLFIL